MNTDNVKRFLTEKSNNLINEFHKAFIVLERKTTTSTMSIPEGYNKNNISLGKYSIVNRVRGGKVQMRRMVANAVGYKVLDGKLIRMSPVEIRRRKIAAKRSAIKRRSQIAAIVRKRGISMRKRKMRFGA